MCGFLDRRTTRAVLIMGLSGGSVLSTGTEVQLCSTTTIAATNATDPDKRLNMMLF
jgi:hypothetical protein